MQERQRWDKVSTALENTLQAQKIFLVFTSKPMILLFSNDTLFSPHSSQTPGSNVCFMYVQCLVSEYSEFCYRCDLTQDSNYVIKTQFLSIFRLCPLRYLQKYLLNLFGRLCMVARRQQETWLLYSFRFTFNGKFWQTSLGVSLAQGACVLILELFSLVCSF